MPLFINERSQLKNARLYDRNGTQWWSRMEPPEIEPDETDQLHVVGASDRLDILASYYYANPRMKWVIARANGIRLEPNDLIPGREIRIPRFDRLQRQGLV